MNRKILWAVLGAGVLFSGLGIGSCGGGQFGLWGVAAAALGGLLLLNNTNAAT